MSGLWAAVEAVLVVCVRTAWHWLDTLVYHAGRLAHSSARAREEDLFRAVELRDLTWARRLLRHDQVPADAMAAALRPAGKW